MKKLTVVLLALIGVFAFALCGCSNGDAFTEKSYSSGENGIEKIVVQVEDRELEISASEDNRVYIGYFDGEKEYLDISVSESKELTVKLLYNKNWTDFFGVKPSAEYRKIKIKIPDNLLVSFSASTTNENIILNSLSFTESLSLDVNGGDIVCEQVNAGKFINLKAKSGNVMVKPLTFAEQISIEAIDGNVVCEGVGVGKSVSLTAKNGNITGSVLGEWDDFSIFCKIKKGDCNLPLNKKDGEKLFTADCNNGNINIEFVK